MNSSTLLWLMALVVQTSLVFTGFDQTEIEKKAVYALLFLFVTLSFQWQSGWNRRLRRYDPDYQERVGRRADWVASVGDKLGIPREKSTIPILCALVFLAPIGDVLLPIGLGYLLWLAVA